MTAPWRVMCGQPSPDGILCSLSPGHEPPGHSWQRRNDGGSMPAMNAHLTAIALLRQAAGHGTEQADPAMVGDIIGPYIQARLTPGMGTQDATRLVNEIVAAQAQWSAAVYRALLSRQLGRPATSEELLAHIELLEHSLVMSPQDWFRS